jgi:hypothetical protein
MRRRKQSKQQEQQKKHKTPSLKSLSDWVDFEAWRGFDLLIVSWSICFCSCIACGVQKTWMAWMVVVGGIYSPNHYSSCCRWHIGQSGGAPDMTLFIVQCMPHQLPVGVWSSWPLNSFVLLRHQTVRWHTGQSGAFWLRSSDFWLLHYALSLFIAVDRCSVGSPDMSGAHRTVRWIIAERLWEKTRERPVRGCLGLGTGQCPVHYWQHQRLSLLLTLLSSPTQFLCWLMLNFIHLRYINDN